MDTRLIGIYLIGLILLSVIIAFIVSPGFRRDVIASEGEAALFGVINVRGVIIVLLTAIFTYAFIHIISLDSENRPSFTTADAIDLLKKSPYERYQIINRNDTILVKINNAEVGTFEFRPAKLITSRKEDAREKWNIQLQNRATVGYIDLKYNQEYFRNNTGQKVFELRQPYRINDLNLWFVIDSVKYYYRNREPGYDYWIRFGEGDNERHVDWLDQPEHFIKTSNARIFVNDGYRHVRNPKWKSDYYIGLGLGQPAVDSASNRMKGYVELLNLMVLESRLE